MRVASINGNDIQLLKKEPGYVCFSMNGYLFKAGWDGVGWNIYECWYLKSLCPVFANGGADCITKNYVKEEVIRVLGLRKEE